MRVHIVAARGTIAAPAHRRHHAVLMCCSQLSCRRIRSPNLVFAPFMSTSGHAAPVLPHHLLPAVLCRSSCSGYHRRENTASCRLCLVVVPSLLVAVPSYQQLLHRRATSSTVIKALLRPPSIPCSALFVCHPKVEERSNFYTLPLIIYFNLCLSLYYIIYIMYIKTQTK